MNRLPIAAVAMMLTGMALIPAGDSAGKLLVTEHGTTAFYVAWTRFGLGALVAFGVVLAGGHLPRRALYADWRIWLRALLIVGGIVNMLMALRTEPIANVFGAFFVGPVFSYVLSATLLREPVSVTRTALLLAGFAGVLLVVRPGFGMTPGLGFAVMGGLCYGAYLTASRWLSEAARPAELLLSQLVIGALVLAPLAVPTLPNVTPALAGLTLASALCSMLGNLLLVMAYRLAPASRLAPFVYFQLVAATVLGLVIFGDVPDTLALAGLGLLCAAGFATFALGRKGV